MAVAFLLGGTTKYEALLRGRLEGKLTLLINSMPPHSVADLCYTGEFESTLRDCLAECQALLDETKSKILG